MSQSSPITLAAGRINQSDRLRVELFKTDDREMTLIVWPKRPTPVSARKLSETGMAYREPVDGLGWPSAELPNLAHIFAPNVPPRDDRKNDGNQEATDHRPGHGHVEITSGGL